MTSTSVVGFDHAETELLRLLLDAEIKVVESFDDVGDAHIAIVHTVDESAWPDVLEESPEGSIRIRTSSQGRSGNGHRVTMRGVVELNLQPSHVTLSADEFVYIVSELIKPGIARAVVEGTIPPGLVRFFGIERVREILPSISILCQGHLAVNARFEDGDWGPPEIRPALKQMGWLEAMKDDAVRGLLRNDLLDQRDVVAKADWWLDVFELEGDVATQVKTLQDKLKEEWNESTDTQLPDEITQLLEALAEGTPKAPGVVGDAYCKIAEKLGGSPCQS